MDISNEHTATIENDSLNTVDTTPEKSPIQQHIQSKGNSASDASKNKSRLRDLVKKVSDAVSKGRSIGKELKEIKDSKLYKVDGFRSFSAFCQKKFDITSTHAYRMIRHYEMCELLGEDCSKIFEKVMRPLSELSASDEHKRSIWEKLKAASGGNSLSAGAVVTAVSEYKRSLPQPETSADDVYVKALKKKVERTRLVETLISETKSLKELISACEPVKQELNEAELAQLKETGHDRVNSFFAVTAE